ncbi:MAG: MopE-related protein [Myxococcota bacterium]
MRLLLLVSLLGACTPKEGEPVSSDADGDGFLAADDCDDNAAAVNPDAAELCDEVDNDCSGGVDDEPEDGRLYYADADGDGYYGDSETVIACNIPSGYGFSPDDCDDTNGAIYPEAAEACDGLDNDCDGSLPSDETDADGDAFIACAECDDGDGDTFPGAPEVCDEIDNNCDGEVDENGSWFRDADTDGYGSAADTTQASCDEPPAGYVANDDDCDDTERAISPAATEVCDTANDDEDCDGVADDADESTAGQTTFYRDADKDGYGDDIGTPFCDARAGYSTSGGDCDDTTAIANPAEAEACGDGVDNDCDGSAGTECGPDGVVELSDSYARIRGEVSGDHSGESVASAGDVNGDGYADLIIGAYGDNDGGSDAGAAYLVYHPVSGRLELSAAAAKLIGEQANSWAGLSVASAGDMNGDGYADLFVGAYGDGDGGFNAGAAYVVHGPVYGDLDLSLADAKLIGERTNDLAGYSVASAGDVNGDGYGDLVVGSMEVSDGGSGAGAAYVVYGPVSGELDLSLAGARLIGEDAGDYAGYSVASAGDVNRDGYADLIIGSAFAEAAYLIYGPVSGDIDLSLADARLIGDLGIVGNSVAGAGDVNADGYDDLIIGSFAATAYLVLGPVSGDVDLSLADARFTGETAGSSGAGSSVAAAGDVNGDGYADLIIGAASDSEGGSFAGAAYLVYGPVSGDLDLELADVKLIGRDESEGAGCAVASAGDVNADGYDDVIVGACGSGRTYAAYLILGGPGL